MTIFHFSGTHCVGPLVDKMDTNNMRFFNLSELSEPPNTSNSTNFTTLAPVIQPWPIKIGDSIMYKCEPYTHRSVSVFQNHIYQVVSVPPSPSPRFKSDWHKTSIWIECKDNNTFDWPDPWPECVDHTLCPETPPAQPGMSSDHDDTKEYQNDDTVK